MLHMFRWISMLMVALWASSIAFAQPAAVPRIGTAFVATTNFETGSYSVIDLNTLMVFPDIVPDGINSDTVVRYDSITNLLYAVNRFGADSIQVIDPTQGYMTPLGMELSVDNGSNPHDIALINPNKAYVSRAGQAEVLIIDPSALMVTGSIDLSSLMKPTDLDNSPEPYRMLVRGDTVYLLLQHLDRLQELQPPLAPGEIVVIDAIMDTVSTVIPLTTPNPFSDLQYTAALPRGPRLLVSNVNAFGVVDGGIEAVDLATNTVDQGVVLSETAVNGDITFFEVVSATQAYAIVGLADGTFTNTLVQFNPSTGVPISTLATFPPPSVLLNFAINNSGELYIGGVGPAMPGVRIFNTASAQEITAAPIPVGNLPPGWITMVEQRQVALTVHKDGTGTGEVSSFPDGLVCGAVCTQNFPVGSAVVLTAVADMGSTFVGWQAIAAVRTPGIASSSWIKTRR